MKLGIIVFCITFFSLIGCFGINGSESKKPKHERSSARGLSFTFEGAFNSRELDRLEIEELEKKKKEVENKIVASGSARALLGEVFKLSSVYKGYPESSFNTLEFEEISQKLVYLDEELVNRNASLKRKQDLLCFIKKEINELKKKN